VNQKGLWILVATGLLATILWNTDLLLPLKLLIVLVHEIWHGLISLLCGAQLDGIEISTEESGETLITGLNSVWGFILAVSAGYIGSTLVGSLLLIRGLSGQFERISLSIFAVLLGYMCFLFTKTGGLASYTGLGWTIVLIVISLVNRNIARYTLIVTGTLFIWYCIYDMFDFTGDIQNTDAGILASFLTSRGLIDMEINSLSYAISIIWSLIMIGIIIIFMRNAILNQQEAENEIDSQDTDEEPVAFPGEMTPEIMEWLLRKGFGPDGQPLPEELREPVPGEEQAVNNNQSVMPAENYL